MNRDAKKSSSVTTLYGSVRTVRDCVSQAWQHVEDCSKESRLLQTHDRYVHAHSALQAAVEEMTSILPRVRAALADAGEQQQGTSDKNAVGAEAMDVDDDVAGAGESSNGASGGANGSNVRFYIIDLQHRLVRTKQLLRDLPHDLERRLSRGMRCGCGPGGGSAKQAGSCVCEVTRAYFVARLDRDKRGAGASSELRTSHAGNKSTSIDVLGARPYQLKNGRKFTCRACDFAVLEEGVDCRAKFTNSKDKG